MYRHLNAEKTFDTIGALSNRISERFPSSGLSRKVWQKIMILHKLDEREGQEPLPLDV